MNLVHTLPYCLFRFLLRLGLPSSHIKPLFTFFFSPICATCPAYLILPELIIIILFGDVCKSRSSSLCSCLQPRFVLSYLDPNWCIVYRCMKFSCKERELCEFLLGLYGLYYNCWESNGQNRIEKVRSHDASLRSYCYSVPDSALLYVTENKCSRPRERVSTARAFSA
jgi:hypothetical protein